MTLDRLCEKLNELECTVPLELLLFEYWDEVLVEEVTLLEPFLLVGALTGTFDGEIGFCIS